MHSNTLATLLDGRKCANNHLNQLREKIATQLTTNQAPGLAVIQVGHDPASSIYVRKKKQACESIGMQAFSYDWPPEVTQTQLLDCIESLNQNHAVHGILIQLPLPDHIETQAILEAIYPSKDVDGFHPYNIGRLAQKKPKLQPCTPYGIQLLLADANCSLAGLDVVIVGASNIVGRPAALSCLLANATVTICHKATRNLSTHIQRADCLIVAIGNPDVINPSDIKPGAIIIDVGINRTASGAIVGDVPFEAARERAGWITPVPGGVGPMTVAALLMNTWQAYQYQTDDNNS